ncbi:hypothetical protein KLEP174_gp14 [Pseudomonas phage vB_PcuM_ KLEP17-4]|nr:hypothetical protein KLEP174_gp14 [Pseudomonas phage vB_PcuM_ KLEP17-4]
MNDNQLTALIRTQLLAGLSRLSLTSEVLGNQQPTTQGRTTVATLYFSAINEQRYGWQYSRTEFLPLTETLEREEAQWVRTTYQVTALAPQDPSDLTIPTPKDLLRSASLIINGQSFVQAMTAQGVGIERVTELRNPYFVNDQGQFEASPSFDFTVTRKEAIIQEQPAFESVECNFTRV